MSYCDKCGVEVNARNIYIGDIPEGWGQWHYRNHERCGPIVDTPRQNQLTAKQIHNRAYYQANRETILAQKRKQTPEEILHDEINIAENKAWDALARYKFQMFGYWAAIWVHLNRIAGEHRSNPWAGLVEAARQRIAPGMKLFESKEG